MSEIVYIPGNHEDRLTAIQESELPQFEEDALGLHKLVKASKRSYLTIKSLGDSYRLGKVHFIHGENYGGDTFAKKTAIACHRNVRVWHNHTNQSYASFSPLDSKDIMEVKGIGCLCKKNPEYMIGHPNRWINSFLEGYVFPDGSYNDYTVNVINGRFIAPDGKLYK
jgi:hypothetical protein